MDKRDIPRSRNANELERKYNLGSILQVQEAVQQTEKGLTATQNEIETFVNETTSQLGNIGDILGSQDTYYMSGVPGLNTLPASEWNQTEYEEHDGDLYYDKETGKVYKFEHDDNTTGWFEVTTPTLASTLAIANASNDVLDGKRTTFTTQPQPPYSCGDIWLNDGVLYVCQIGRNSGTYQTDDFILASSASYSEALGENYNLTVSQGKVTKLIADTDSLGIELTDEVRNRTAIVRATVDNGVEVGLSSSPVKTLYKNDGMYIQENGTNVAYFKNNKAYNSNMEVTNVLTVGNFSFMPRDNGNMSIIYTGGN